MHSKYYIGIALLVISGILISLVVIPNEKEIALMELQDRYFDDSFKKYKSLIEAGDISASVVVPLKRLYLLSGDVESAIFLMEKYVKKYPNYTLARKELGELYKNAQESGRYKELLEASGGKDHSGIIWRELSEMYHDDGEYEKLEALLEKLITSLPDKATEHDYIYLAYLYAKYGKIEEAIAVMDRLFDSSMKYSINAIELATSLLVDNAKFDRATELAKNYISDSRGEAAVNAILSLTTLIENKGRPDIAFYIIEEYHDEAEESPALFVRMLELQLALHKEREMYTFLEKRFKDGGIPNEAVGILVSLVLENKDVKLLKEIINRADISILSEVQIIRFADVIQVIKAPELIDKITKNLGRKYDDLSDLTKEVMRFVSGGGKDIVALLKAQEDAQLSDDLKVVLASVYHSANHDEMVGGLIENVAIDEVLEVFEAEKVAELFLQLGMGDKALKRLMIAWDEYGVDDYSKIAQAWGLLSSGLGNQKALMEWVKKTKLSNQLLATMYYFADKYLHYDLSLELAEILYERSKIPTHILYYAEALIRTTKYNEALVHLKPLVENGDESSEYLYFAALGELSRNEGEEAVKKYNDNVEKILNRIFNRGEIDERKKRDIAYAVLEAGFKDKSATLFFDIARKKEASSPDVEQVVYLWGEKPRPNEIKWLERRYEKAETTDDRALWLGYLNTTGQFEAVIALIGDDIPLSGREKDAYMQALVKTHDKAKLAELITSEVKTEKNPERLLKLAMFAMEEELSTMDLVEEVFKDILAEDPGNMEVNRHFGQLEYRRGNFTNAKDMFAVYLSKNDGDYVSNFYMGEILWHKKSFEKAGIYHERAKKQLDKLIVKDLEAEWTEAHLLFRRDKLKQSLVLFESLVNRHVDNKDLKADFAEVLIESGKYKKAEEVLLGL